MRTAAAFYLLTQLLFGLLCFPANSSDTSKVVFRFEIREEIMPGTARMVDKAMRQAQASKADVVLIHMNTYGGMLDAADLIRTNILNSPLKSIVFIDNNAASAGALISISCNKIYMRSGANIGAATVVDMEAKALPDKYQSYMRSMMRATAEKRGRDPKIAEAMVDPRTYIPGVNDSGKVLTFTTSEAIKNNFCDGQAESISELLEKENLTGATQVVYEKTFIDKMLGYLMNPAVSGVLILIILGGIYFELQTPGIGFPLIASVIAAVLYFAPLYLEGLAANWEIVLVVVGFILLVVEIFVFPGFGLAGIAGIIFIVFGFTLSLVPNEGFDFTFTGTDAIMHSLTIVLSSLIGSVVLFFIFGKKLISSKQFNRMVLQDAMGNQQGYVSSDLTAIAHVGETATTYTDLRPSGKILLDGKVVSASAESGFIERGKAVTIIAVDGIKITVRVVRDTE